ncbi:MAG: hypothetical protein Q8P86_03700 [bacterium]|nr:hypothetical protein [bacterium]
MQDKHNTLILDIALLTIVSAGLFSFLTLPREDKNRSSVSAVAMSAEVSQTEIYEEKTDPFKDISLEAKAAIVYDTLNDEVLYALNENTSLPLASLTKVMTAMTALSLIPDYTIIPIEKSFLEMEGDNGLYVDEKWLLRDLIDFTLMTSSNDGARAIATVAGRIVANTEDSIEGRTEFLARMNKKAKDLNLTRTFFLNENGLDESRNLPGAYGSAKDMAVLFWEAFTKHPSVFGVTREENVVITSLDKIQHNISNTNKAVNSIPRLMGSKTGFTELAGGNLVFAIDAGFKHPVIVVILGSTPAGRFEDAEKLAWAALQGLSQK